MNLRAVAIACALAAGLGGASAFAAAEDQRDASRDLAQRRIQFEQMLAFLRARGDAVVPRSPYDPVSPAKRSEAESQFERSGGKPVPLPPTYDQLFEQSIAKTFHQMMLGGGCCPCSAAGTCNDGLFCNGVEICAAGNCASGAAACNDGNPCTTDSCTENTDTCLFTPVPPPAAVAQLNVSRSAPGSPVANLVWSAVSGASTYNVYRGTAANLSNLACFQSGLTGTSQSDDGTVPAGAFYFLVTSKACGESSLGTGQPNPRPPAPGCP